MLAFYQVNVLNEYDDDDDDDDDNYGPIHARCCFQKASFITSHDSVTRGHSYKLIRQHFRVNARANFFYQSCYCSLEFTA